jgi:chitodextrinase
MRTFQSRSSMLVAFAAVALLMVAGGHAATRTPPTNLSPPTISGSPVQGQTLTASTGSWSGSPRRYTYAWRACDGSGASCSKIITGTSNTYQLTANEVGHTIRVIVRAWSGSGGNSAATSAPTAVVTAPQAKDTSPPTAPSGLTSTPTAAQIQLAWSASRDNVGVTGYTVYLNGAQVNTTADTSYTYAGLACSTTYTLAVDAYDAAGNHSTQSSVTTPTAACPASAPAITALPSVSGTAQVGQTLSSSAGSWSGSTPISYGYQWLRCDAAGAGCGAIAGATGSSYTAVAADQGLTLRSQVTGTNSAGSASARSAQTAPVAAAPTPTPTPAAGLHVSGNLLLDAAGNRVHLHGVNYSGTEYACIQGWGIFDGPSDDAMINALVSWNVNVVHIGLNEDCILAINGAPAAYAGSNYLNAIVAYVNRLHAHGLYAEVSLMWAAPGTQQALDHPPILDQDHAPAALTTIANAFKNDPKTFIGLQSEPHAISWACWLNGGSSCNVGYPALGMQAALNAVRSTGATNVVTASGIDYANNLSQWLQNKPTDPQNQLIAEAHVYGGNSCATTSCFDTNYAPVANTVPIVFGETGETYDGSSCAGTNITTFMNWADTHNIGYETWTWDTWGNCSSLITDYNGTPNNTYGTTVKNHYLTQP